MVVENLTVKYGENTVFNNFNYEFKENKITVIMGESGIGKTTLLNVISSLLNYSGKVEKKGRVSYVFQEPRLIDNLSVLDNLLIIENDRQKIEKLLEKVGLLDKINEFPENLSGGQKQRVSIVRAFLFGGETVLLDEPFSSLDVSLKYNLINELISLQKENNSTVIEVTHDLYETLYIADEILVLKKDGYETVSVIRENGKAVNGEEVKLKLENALGIKRK